MQQIIGRMFSVGEASYIVAEEIGSGGFGTVFRATSDDRSAPDLVVKVPAPHVVNNDEWRRRFQREARILGNLSHPNVVSTMGLLSYDDGALLLVQEIVSNATEFYTWESPSPEALVSVTLQILYGLRATHRKSADARAIHRDLSPRNILVTGRNGVKIIDFGLAKEDPRTSTILTVAGNYFGTPGCMAPEQRKDSASVDHRADLYALGRTVASRIQNRDPEFVEVGTLPYPWQPIIEQLTAYNPGDRFDDADSVICRVLHDFGNEGVLPSEPRLHFEEFRTWDAVPSAWATVAGSYFTEADELQFAHLRLAFLVSEATFKHTRFPIDEVFGRLETDVFAARFDEGQATFSSCDPVGDMLVEWFPYMNPGSKQVAFRRLCKMAVMYHRYRVMSAVRTAYAGEKDPAFQARFLEILNEEDPEKTIHGKGIIPR
jgi:serine/threonine protein kinase